jgi:hypothetical protein
MKVGAIGIGVIDKNSDPGGVKPPGSMSPFPRAIWVVL